MKMKLFFINCLFTPLILAQEPPGRVIIDVDPLVDRLLNSWENDSPSKDPVDIERAIKDVDPCVARPKRRGYKIQILSLKDRQEAQEKLKELIDIYPDLYPELRFESPNYKIQLGDYLSKSSYEDDLIKIRRRYPYAFPVPAYVWCRRAR